MITTKGKTFTIERSKWLRGEGANNSMLFRSDGKLCCLGQVCQQLGFSESDMLKQESPSNLRTLIEGLTEVRQCRKVVSDTVHGSEMMRVNDETLDEWEDREQALSELAQQAGFSLKFID